MQAKVMPKINNFDIPSIYYDSILNGEQYIPSNKIPKLLSNQNTKTSFTALSLNVQLLNNIHNFLKLESFLHSINVQPSILAITETWLKKNQTSPHTNLCNYTFVSNSRSQSRGEGVGLYVNCSLNFTMRSDLTIMHEKNFVSLFIEIESSNSTMICGVIYRPPSKNSKSHALFFEHLINIIKSIKNKPCFLFSDFNYSLLNYDNPHIADYADMLFENCFIPLIKKPTWFNANSGSLIDHIWTNVSLDNFICPAIITHPLSDHLPLFLSYANSIDPQSEPKMQRFFSSAKITLFNNELQKVNIDLVLKETDTDISFKVLLKDYMNLFNKYFPKQVIKGNRRNHNWFDDELKKLLSNKEALFKKYMQTKSPKTKRQFTKACNLYFKKMQRKNKNTLKINWNLIETTEKLPGGLSIAFWGKNIYLSVILFTQIPTK